VDIESVIRDAAARYGQDPTPWLKTGQIESGFNPNEVHPRSKAAGLFQFIPSTWAKYGNGANPLDPAANADAAMRLARDNTTHFQARMGRPPTPGEVYLMHQQGARGATDLLMNPDKPAGAVVGMNAVMQNGGHTGMTGRDFANLWTSKFDGGAVPGVTGAAPSAPVDVAPPSIQQPSPLADAFANAGKIISDGISQPYPKKVRGNSRFIDAQAIA
jgi:hypothetical protein